MARYNRNGGQAAPPQPAEKKEPVQTFSAYSGSGYVRIAVWENLIGEGNDQRLVYAVSVSRAYKDGDTWKDSKSLRDCDLPHAILLLQRAWMFIQHQGEK